MPTFTIEQRDGTIHQHIVSEEDAEFRDSLPSALHVLLDDGGTYRVGRSPSRTVTTAVGIPRSIIYFSHEIWDRMASEGLVEPRQATDEIDHINRYPLDDRRPNLRKISRTGNNQNKLRRKDNLSGHQGVSRKNPEDQGPVWKCRVSLPNTNGSQKTKQFDLTPAGFTAACMWTDSIYLQYWEYSPLHHGPCEDFHYCKCPESGCITDPPHKYQCIVNA